MSSPPPTSKPPRFNPPPNWPPPPPGWTPPPGWVPDPDWPPPPEDWQLWTEDPGSPAAMSVILCPKCSQLCSLPDDKTGFTCPNCHTFRIFRRCKNCAQPVLVSGAYTRGSRSLVSLQRLSCENAEQPTVGEPRGHGEGRRSESLSRRVIGLSFQFEVAALAGGTLIGGWNLPFRIGILVAMATTSTELHLTPANPPGPPVIYLSVTWSLSNSAALDSRSTEAVSLVADSGSRVPRRGLSQPSC